MELQQVTAVKLFVCNKEDILLLRRSEDDLHRPGEMDLPGGELNPGETIIDAACREAYEETGLLLARQAIREVCRIVNVKPSVDDPSELILLERVFEVAETGDRNARISGEHSAGFWIPRRQALDHITHPCQRDAFEQIGRRALWPELLRQSA